MRIAVGAEMVAALARWQALDGIWHPDEGICKAWDLEHVVLEATLWHGRLSTHPGVVALELALYVPRRGQPRTGPLFFGRRRWLPRARWGPLLFCEACNEQWEPPQTRWNGYSRWWEVWQEHLEHVVLSGLRYDAGAGKRCPVPPERNR